MFNRKKKRIISLENQLYGLRQQLERQDYSFQLTVPVITNELGEDAVRFSGSPKAIEALQKYFNLKYKKRPSKPLNNTREE